MRLLRLKFPGSALFVLTLVDEPAAVQRVLDAGVDGYMLKSVAPSQFFFGLRAVAGGASYLQPSLGVELARAWSTPSTPLHPTRLSLKETELLRLVARGHTNREIAERRCVSLRTIEAQRANVVVKLGLHTRAELSRYARSIGLDAFAV